MTKLSKTDVSQIRKMYRATGGAYGVQSKLARAFGCTSVNIYYIVTGKTRKRG